MTIPEYWKSGLDDIDAVVKTVKKGRVTRSKSAGGRDIYTIEYGKRNEWNRSANFASARACGNTKLYADKTKPEVKPCLLLVGAQHGAEIEGIVALLNLISVIETGSDLAGMKIPEYDTFINIEERMHLVIIPCINPDGRARLPHKTVAGMSLEEFRYYAQGTWKDGSLANWPACMSIHPLKDSQEYLGAYFNDDGINLVQDNFFSPMAEETRLLIKLTDEMVPDVTMLLHGGTNCTNLIMQPKGVPLYFKNEAMKIAQSLHTHCEEYGLRTEIQPIVTDDGTLRALGSNACFALTHNCGELCLIYESNQGLSYSKNILTYDEIYLHHILLFEELIAYAVRKNSEYKEEK